LSSDNFLSHIKTNHWKKFIRMKKKWCLSLLLCFLTGSLWAQEWNIEISELPGTAQTFLSSNFPDIVIKSIQREKRISLIQFEVKFNNGDKVKFDRNGKWTDVKCKDHAVPAKVVPAKISAYIEKNFKDSRIEEIENDRRYYDVKLDNGANLTFNRIYKLIGYDL